MDHLYSLYDALVSVNVPNDKARAVVDAMESDMDRFATKTEIKAEFDLVRQEIASSREMAAKDILSLREVIAHQSNVVTVRLGSLIAGAIAIFYTVQRLG